MKNIMVFAGDLADAAQQRRILALRSLGYQVSVIGFRKSDDPISMIGEHLDLGRINNGKLTERIRKICGAIPNSLKHIRQQKNIDLIYARNMDMLLFAWLIRLLTWSRIQIYYEVLDIHGAFTNGGLKQTFARTAERFLLRRTGRLIVSSPDFISQYFDKIQGFKGEWRLLENKIWHGSLTKVRPSYKRSETDKMRIGWVGNIRCQPSFQILMRLADHMDNVEIHIHGTVHNHALLHFDHHVAARLNVIYHGPYEYPKGLFDVYRSVDLVWASDLWQVGANSSWLLPNRLYEAAWHGCPSICIAGTATARKVDDLGIGYLIQDANSVDDFFQTITLIQAQEKRRQILDMDPALFCMSPAEVENAISFAPILRDRLPDFVCIGSMRAGTTTLYDYCAQHPEIGVSRIKETDYFIKSKNLHKGLNWYKELFPKRAKVSGEFSPNYSKASVFPDVPERMHAVIPNAKIIYIVRHPVDRAISQYNHAYFSGQNPPDVAHLLGTHEWAHLIDTSSYMRQMKLYLKYYHASQLLILNFDDLIKNPCGTLAKVSDFLGVSNDWSLDAVNCKNASISLAALPKSVFRAAEFPMFSALKSYIPHRFRQWVKLRLETKKLRIPPVFPDNVKLAMWMDMYPDITEFGDMTGIKFTPPAISEHLYNHTPDGCLKETVNASS